MNRGAVDQADRRDRSAGEPRFNKRVSLSAHPRTRARLDAFGLKPPPAIEFIKPLGFFDYVKAQQRAFCVISDSGTITEEASILGFPAITPREAHERPEGMDEAAVLMVVLDPERMTEAVRGAAVSPRCPVPLPARLRRDQRISQGRPDHPELSRSGSPHGVV